MELTHVDLTFIIPISYCIKLLQISNIIITHFLVVDLKNKTL